MRKLMTLMLALGFVLAFSAAASAFTITLTKIGGTATTVDGTSSLADGTVTLEIALAMDPGDPDMNGIFLSSDIGGTGTYGLPTDVAFHFFAGGAGAGQVWTPLIPGVVCGAVECGQWDLQGGPVGFQTTADWNTFGPVGGILGTVTVNASAAGTITVGSGVNAVLDGITTTAGNIQTANATYNIVPEPTTAIMLGFGLFGLAIAGRSRS